ncbi:hypothetical protein LZ30DRAFT_7805 [Colletotrichum cereale]|nr:hypothetical protein LZ30DRAFT_7805 [Colletotrichum cereale]
MTRGVTSRERVSRIANPGGSDVPEESAKPPSWSARGQGRRKNVWRPSPPARRPPVATPLSAPRSLCRVPHRDASLAPLLAICFDVICQWVDGARGSCGSSAPRSSDITKIFLLQSSLPMKINEKFNRLDGNGTTCKSLPPPSPPSTDTIDAELGNTPALLPAAAF